MRKAAIGFVALVSIIGTPVLAADMAVKAPPPPVLVDSWTGFYVGANVGGGWGRQSVYNTPNDPLVVSLFEFGGAPPPASFTSSGILGGVQVGYNRQVNGRWLIGFETDFDGSGIKGSGSTSGTYAPYFMAPFIAPVQERVDWFGTVRARLGFLPTNNFLLYGTAGFAYGRVTHNGSWNTNTPFAVGDGFHDINCFPVPVCFAGSSSHVEPGWTAGGGLEYALWQKWTLRAEYLFVSLRQGTITEMVLGHTGTESPSSFNAIFNRTKFNVARVGLNYEFH